MCFYHFTSTRTLNKMKLFVAFIAVGIIGNALAAITTDAVKESLVFHGLGKNCRCQDKFASCYYYRAMCSTAFMFTMCPVTCYRCPQCTKPTETTEAKSPSANVPISAPMEPCSMNCTDTWPQEMCARYKSSGQCSVLKSYCDLTCGMCRKCVLPPAKECKEDCNDTADEYSCAYWKSQGRCSVNDVRYVCQRTCKECLPCRGESDFPLQCT